MDQMFPGYASGLNKRDDEFQVNTLNYFMGDEAEDILNASTLTPDEKLSYTAVENCFKVQGSLLFVTYTIIQGIISSEMLVRTGPLNGKCKKKIKNNKIKIT